MGGDCGQSLLVLIAVDAGENLENVTSNRSMIINNSLRGKLCITLLTCDVRNNMDVFRITMLLAIEIGRCVQVSGPLLRTPRNNRGVYFRPLEINGPHTMGKESLASVLDDTADTVELLRSNGGRHPYPVPAEHTNWIDEVTSWRTSVSLSDLSHHQKDLYVEGPDALAPFIDLGINDFSGFEPGNAKQFVACNEDGYLIGDAILFYLEDGLLKLTGTPIAPNWVAYTVEHGDYDVRVSADERYWDKDEPHETFRYQLQGPHAVDVMEAASDSALPDIPFFNIREISIAGHHLQALKHSMVAEPGFEFWGPWEDRHDVRDAIVAAGEEYGLRCLGEKSYKAQGQEKGWIARPVPAIYGDEFSAYHEWLPADTYESQSSLGGSFDPGDIEAYYLDPIELGYERFIDWDRDFIGRDALREKAEEGARTKVSLVWNHEDILKLFGSLLEEGTPYKYFDLSEPYWSVFHYDAVTRDGDIVGVSKYFGYSYNEREVISLAVIDSEVSDPGTEVSLVWGEPGGTSPNPAVEDHRQTEIRATVGPVPYTKD